MNMTISKRHVITRELAAVAMGTLPADLILKNGNLVDVCTARVRSGCGLAVYKGFIACVGSCENILTGTDTKIVDVTEKYLCPGLIDSHMHVESSMVDLPGLIPAITKNPGMDTRFFTLVTDDVTPATINAAQLLEQTQWIGSPTPGRAADILVVGTDDAAMALASCAFDCFCVTTCQGDSLV
jgi:adenine deaminase